MREIRMLRTTWRELETELRDGLRHRQMAKADGNSYSPCLRPPRQLSTLPEGAGREQSRPAARQPSGNLRLYPEPANPYLGRLSVGAWNALPLNALECEWIVEQITQHLYVNDLMEKAGAQLRTHRIIFSGRTVFERAVNAAHADAEHRTFGVKRSTLYDALARETGMTYPATTAAGDPQGPRY